MSFSEIVEAAHTPLILLGVLLEVRILWRQRHQNHRHTRVYCEKHEGDR